jgi:transcriptional regulator with XRE-family HTH domain
MLDIFSRLGYGSGGVLYVRKDMDMSENPSGKTPAKILGEFLADLRAAKGLTLREVEEATDKEVSNAYLSQLEHGKVNKPSPHILYSLSEVYGVPYERLMEKAGYISPATQEREAGTKHGRAATFAIDNLTDEEEKALLEYLAFFRSRKREGKD